MIHRKMPKGKIAAVLLMAAMAGTSITGCTNKAALESTAASQSTPSESDKGQEADRSLEVTVDKEFTDRDKEGSYEESSGVKINLTTTGAKIEGDGAAVSGSTVTISKEGTYIVSGTLKNGQIIVDAADTDKVQLVLENAEINCDTSAAIYVKNSDKVFVTLAEGSTNKLLGGTEYIDTDENTVDGVIFSKDDLTVNGSGSLEVTASYKHGIVSKDTLTVTGGNLTVTAVSQCLSGKDEVKILNGTFQLTTQGKAVKSDNSEDTSLGNIYVAGGNFTVKSEDDSFHASGNVVIDGGTFLVESGDDAFHANQDVLINDGNITVSSSYEGLEGYRVTVNGGDIKITATDDGINAAEPGSSGSKTENPQRQSGQRRSKTPQKPEETKFQLSESKAFDEGLKRRGGSGGMGSGMENNTNAYIKITGGTLYVDAEGDGIDSNGSLMISGGMVYVTGPVTDGNGAIDYNGDGIITGGIVVAAGSAGMAQGFSDSSAQCSLLYNFSAAKEAGTAITLTDQGGNELINFTPDKKYSSVVISSPKMQTGSTYTLTAGSEQTELTLQSVVTSNASRKETGGSRMP